MSGIKTNEKEYEIGITTEDFRYGINEVFFCQAGKTVKQVINEEGSLIHVVLHTGYRPTAKILHMGSNMFTDLGEYETSKDAKKFIDNATKIVNKNVENFTFKIEMVDNGYKTNPIVTSELRGEENYGFDGVVYEGVDC